MPHTTGFLLGRIAGRRGMRWRSVAKMRNDVLTEKIDRVHRPFVRDRPELHHREELIELRFLLQPFDLLHHGIGAAADAHAIVDQRIERDLARVETFVLLGQCGVQAPRLSGIDAGFFGFQHGRVGDERGSDVGHECLLRLCARLFVGIGQMGHRKRAGSVIRERAVRLRRFDRFAVGADPLSQMLGPDQQGEREQTQSETSRECVRVFAGARDPHRRMRLLDRHRHHGPFRNIEILALVGEGAVLAFPDGGDDVEGLFPARASLLVGNAEAAQLDLRDRSAGTDFSPPLTQDVERCNPLCDANRMVVGEGQQHNGVADADFAGALRNCAVEYLRRRAVRKADLEMMLDGPEMGKAHLLGAHDLVHHVMKSLVLALAMLKWTGYLDFVKDSEVHQLFPLVAGSIAESVWRVLLSTVV